LKNELRPGAKHRICLIDWQSSSALIGAFQLTRAGNHQSQASCHTLKRADGLVIMSSLDDLFAQDLMQ